MIEMLSNGVRVDQAILTGIPIYTSYTEEILNVSYNKFFHQKNVRFTCRMMVGILFYHYWMIYFVAFSMNNKCLYKFLFACFKLDVGILQLHGNQTKKGKKHEELSMHAS